ARPGALAGLKASLNPATAAPVHLTRTQLSAYASSRIDEADGELVESHLEICSECLAEARSLADGAEASAAPSPARTRGHSGESSLVGWTGWATALWRRLALRFLVAGLASAAVLGAVVVFSLELSRGPKQIPATGIPPVTGQPRVSESQGPDPEPQTPPATALLLLDGDLKIERNPAGYITGLESLPEPDQRRIRIALERGDVRVSDALKELSDSAGSVMGGSDKAAFALLDPVGKVVSTDRPTLRWEPPDGAISFRVTITDPAQGYKEIVSSPELACVEWMVEQPLERGHVYTWQVAARTEDGAEVKAPGASSGEARFKILQQSTLDELIKAKRAYGGSHLVMGLRYAEAGLLEEAEREFKALMALNPKSPIARSLLRDVKSRDR